MTVAIIQARMGSERLPGKVLLDIAGQSMLERVVRRVQRSQSIDQVVVATSINPADDRIAASAELLGVLATRGSEDDVLGRFADAAELLRADVCVRVSADSPFIDPEVCSLVVSRFKSANPPVDYTSNKLQPSFPLGLDVEAFSREALERAAREAREPFERSHVTVYMYQNPGRFTLLSVMSDRDLHAWRWTVDTPEDLEFARAIFERLGGGNDFSWRDVVALIEREPELAEINRHVTGRPISAG
ncbi:MAG: glycosyltransferase family protein [Gemmatimonadales bacterium]